MPCSWHRLPDGTVVHINMGRGRTKRCAYCSRSSDVLCDGVLPGGKSCDRPCCRAHAKRIGPDRDLCVECVQAAAKAAREGP